jgi:hypothetical protein
MDTPQANRGIDFKDETLVCCDCGEDFTWSLGEQLYYSDRKLSPPRRCPRCRQERRKRTTRVQNQHTDIDDTFARARQEIEKWR